MSLSRKSAGFTFKQFFVAHDRCGMKVSTDGVMLGAWAPLPDNGRVLDIGTGSGLLALMMAQRLSAAQRSFQIDALEIEPQAASQARENMAQSSWSPMLTVITADVLTWQPVSGQRYGTIICNPPYFPEGKDYRDQVRACARNSQSLSHDKLLQKAAELLTPNGYLAVVLPTAIGQQFIELARTAGWSLASVCQVRENTQRDIHRLLIALTPQPMAEQYQQLSIRETTGHYSAQFCQLTAAFYLNL